jgi:hypothetical protein
VNKEKIAGIVISIIIVGVLVFFFMRGVTIKETIYHAKDDFEKEHLTQCMNYFSPKFFVGHRYSREQIQNRTEELFNQVDNIDVQIVNLDIKQDRDTGWAKVSVKIFATYGGQKIVILGQPIKPFEGELFFEKENEAWKIVRASQFPI